MRIRPNPAGDYPKIDRGTDIDTTVLIIGNVTICEGTGIGPETVIRADEPNSSIIIDTHCLIKGGVVIHALADTEVIVKSSVTVGNGCIVHGPCEIAEGSRIGLGTVIINAVIGKYVKTGNRCVIENCNVSDESTIISGTNLPNMAWQHIKK